MDKSIVTEMEDKADRPERVGQEDSEAQRELMEDLALAERALEEYDAHGIEGTTPYSEYRAKRLGTTS